MNIVGHRSYSVPSYVTSHALGARVGADASVAIDTYKDSNGVVWTIMDNCPSGAPAADCTWSTAYRARQNSYDKIDFMGMSVDKMVSSNSIDDLKLKVDSFASTQAPPAKLEPEAVLVVPLPEPPAAEPEAILWAPLMVSPRGGPVPTPASAPPVASPSPPSSAPAPTPGVSPASPASVTSASRGTSLWKWGLAAALAAGGIYYWRTK